MVRVGQFANFRARSILRNTSAHVCTLVLMCVDRAHQIRTPSTRACVGPDTALVTWLRLIGLSYFNANAGPVPRWPRFQAFPFTVFTARCNCARAATSGVTLENGPKGWGEGEKFAFAPNAPQQVCLPYKLSYSRKRLR